MTADPDMPLRAQAHPRARGDGDDLHARLVVESAMPTRGGSYPGRDELAVAVDELRRQLARLGRNKNAMTRWLGAELTADVVEALTAASRKAESCLPRRQRTPTRAQLDRKLAVAYARRGLPVPTTNPGAAPAPSGDPEETP